MENGFAELVLPPGGRVALYLDELFPEAATSDSLGNLMISADEGTFVAVALELGAGTWQFPTLPVTPFQ